MKLHFADGVSSNCEIIKDGRKYLYFRAKSNSITYREDKTTGEIQVKPYWKPIKGLWTSQEGNAVARTINLALSGEEFDFLKWLADRDGVSVGDEMKMLFNLQLREEMDLYEEEHLQEERG